MAGDLGLTRSPRRTYPVRQGDGVRLDVRACPASEPPGTGLMAPGLLEQPGAVWFRRPEVGVGTVNLGRCRGAEAEVA